MALADGNTVTSMTAAAVQLQVLDDNGRRIPEASRTLILNILEDLPAPIVLGMPWLREVNPSINWSDLTLRVGS